MLATAVGGILLGMIGHETNALIESWENTPTPWQRLARYAIGVLLVFPVFLVMKRQLTSKNEIERDSVAYMMANLSVGVGVVAGYVADSLK